LNLSASLIILALSLVSPPDAVPAPSGANAMSASSLAQAIQTVYAGRQEFAAEFTQEVERPNLPGHPLKKRGRLYFKKPGLMRWDYLEPDKVFYVSDGKILWNYIPESSLAYKMEVGDSELFYALRFLYGEGNLEKDFEVELGAPRDGLVSLVLRPRSGDQNFKSVELLADPDTHEIKQTIVIDPADNRSTIHFNKVSYAPLGLSGFQFIPPKGVMVEDLSKRTNGKTSSKVLSPKSGTVKKDSHSPVEGDSH